MLERRRTSVCDVCDALQLLTHGLLEAVVLSRVRGSDRLDASATATEHKIWFVSRASRHAYTWRRGQLPCSLSYCHSEQGARKLPVLHCNLKASQRRAACHTPHAAECKPLRSAIVCAQV